VVLKSVLKDSAVQLIGRLLGVALTITTLGIISRFYGPEGRGIYEAPTTFLIAFSSFLDLGIFLVALRTLSLAKTPQEKSDRLSEFLGYRILTGIFAYSVAIILTPFLGYSPTVQIGTVIVALSMFLVDLSQTFSAHFQSTRQMYKFVIAESTGRAAILLLTLIGALLGIDILYVISFILVGNIINFLICTYFASRDLKLRVNFSKVKKILIELIPIGSSAFLIALVQSLPGLMVLTLHSESDFGIFKASDKIVLFLGIVPQIYMSANFSNLTGKNNNELKKEGLKTSGAFALIAAAGSIVTYFLAELAVLILNFGNEEFLEGESYSILGIPFGSDGSADVLRLTVISSILIYAYTPISYILFAQGKQKKLIIPSLLGLITVVTFGYFLISEYNYIGAGLASIAAYAVVLVAILYNFLRDKERDRLSGNRAV
jgi:O-antigen/teichoic acid export membrane protein